MEGEWLTYEQAAEWLNTTPEAVRQRWTGGIFEGLSPAQREGAPSRPVGGRTFPTRGHRQGGGRFR
jgi:hypothetical protein